MPIVAVVFAIDLLLLSATSSSHAWGWAAKDDKHKQTKDEKRNSERADNDNKKNDPGKDGNDATDHKGRQQHQQEQPKPSRSQSETSPSLSPPPKKSGRTVDDSVAVNDSFNRMAKNVARFISDSVGVGDADKQLGTSKTLAPIGMDSQVRISDAIATSGIITNILTAPRITVTSPPLLQVSESQDAQIAFDSTADGTYSITIIRDDVGEPNTHQTIKGQMQNGANSVLWQAEDQKGTPLPSGQYSYFITAQNSAGIRDPPPEGDGKIAVISSQSPPSVAALPSPALQLQSISLLPIIAIVLAAVAAGLAALFLMRRAKKPFTIYVPVEAEQVVDDIKAKYPKAVANDYIERTEDGDVKRRIGITIPNSKETEDNEEWLLSIAEKAKELSNVESISLSEGDKTRVL